jgi:hypothetical protein
MQKKEQLSDKKDNSHVSDEPSSRDSKSQTRPKSRSRSDRISYERDFTKDEILSSVSVAVTFFVGVSTSVSYLMLELIDYLYMTFGLNNSYLWIGILFALNSLAILLVRDVVLPYFMKKEYSVYTRFKEEYFDK